MIELTTTSRKHIVTGLRISHEKRDKMLHPDWMFGEGDDPSEVWLVWLTLRKGLLPERTSFLIFSLEDEAIAYANQYPVGAIISEGISGLSANFPKIREMVESLLDAKMDPNSANGGDEDSPLALDVLLESGVLKGTYKGLSEMVLDFVGEDRLARIKTIHLENWEIAAAFEYCLLNFSSSSPAYLAAAYRFNRYIAEDDFAAGYYWRDLEVVYHGVEAEAAKAIDMRRKAGEKGREASAKARKKRIVSLLEAMESIASRNPDFAKLGPKSLAILGLDAATQGQPKLWATGSGQVEEYLGEMRRGEAGEAISSRYLALFPHKSPRRL
jgi:hypothetical protein